MGDYTSLRFKGKLTPQAHMALLIAKEVYRREDNEVPFWTIVRSQGIKIPESYLSNYRANFIPWGACMDPGWGEQKFEIGRNGLIEVVCSLKAFPYEEEVAVQNQSESLVVLFMTEVLPVLIREPCVAEFQFEEWVAPKQLTVSPKESNNEQH